MALSLCGRLCKPSRRGETPLIPNPCVWVSSWADTHGLVTVVLSSARPEDPPYFCWQHLLLFLCPLFHVAHNLVIVPVAPAGVFGCPRGQAAWLGIQEGNQTVRDGDTDGPPPSPKSGFFFLREKNKPNSAAQPEARVARCRTFLPHGGDTPEGRHSSQTR